MPSSGYFNSSSLMLNRWGGCAVRSLKLGLCSSFWYFIFSFPGLFRNQLVELVGGSFADAIAPSL